ncbi:LPS-assembly protein LptD [Ornithobacterium rhinotracheale]|uniref:putative LPS assembly protein LptD n=1 Tax=Ornithobacterium rhinotracheale TaxID=28251 RepID=UPI00129C92FB|nr:putative LPS assembly protein LptD [Ornithobacterium rhinotracheale]MRJ10358.1 LPS-assembly protein LptD [Ornithobacterium rhinotracheale]
MEYKVYNRLIRIILIFIWGLGFAQQNKNVSKSNINSANISKDSLKIDTVKTNSRALQSIVDYTSENVYHDLKNKKSYLEHDAHVQYTDIDISAEFIEINWETGMLFAEGKKDSIGRLIKPSIFKQGENTMEYDNFTYNIKTKKGTASNIRTQQNLGGDNGVVVAKLVKQYSDTVSGLRKVAFTTDEYFINKKDTIADYHLEAEVAKFIQGKDRKVVTGPVFMKIYNVTTPLALPFSFIPMGTDRSTGLLLPSFGERQDVGFYIQGAGIYVPLGDYMDITFTGDIFTKGSYGLHTRSQYKKRYKFSGDFSFDWERRVTGIKGLSSYSKSKLYRLYWSHRQDPKANPNLIFSANVNYTSSKFYRQGLSNYNLISGDVLRNTAQSSISINKTFPNTPFSASLNLSHSQTFGGGSGSSSQNPVNFTLPSLVVNMSRIYPFAPKVGAKKGLLQNMGMTYNFNLQNLIQTNEDDVFTKKMFDDAKNGIKHNLSFNTGTTIFNYFPVNFGGNYQDVWYLKTIEKSYDPATRTVETKDVKGFSTFRTFGVNASVQTTLYGIKVFGSADDNKRIKAIRHVISPSVGFSYTPDFSAPAWGYYDSYINERGEQVLYSKFEGGIYGSPSRGLSESLNLSISNNLEMKIRSKQDSTGVKKVKIFDYLNLSTSYNFAADSLKLSPVSINGATSILDNQMRINFSATVNPYQVLVNEQNPYGVRINKFGKLNLTNYNIGLNYSLNDKTFGDRKIDYPRRGAIRNDVYYFDDQGYAQYLTPWNLSFGLNYSANKNLRGDVNKTTSLNISGRIAPTPYWDISGSTNIDLQSGQISYTRLALTRDLRSFRINFSMVPFGMYKTWNFFIGIKANFLSDALKYEERNFNSGRQTEF